MKSMFPLLGVALLLTACKTTAPTTGVSGEKPPRYAKTVQVATLDTTHRDVSPSLETIVGTDPRPRRVLARLTIEGNADDEGQLINAMLWKARQLGANAVIMGETTAPYATGRSWNLSARERGRRVFRVEAVLVEAGFKAIP